MAAILKIEDNDRNSELEVYPFSDDNLLTIWVKQGDDFIGVSLDETEVKELIEYFQKQLQAMN